MNQSKFPTIAEDSDWLTDAVAECLRLPVDELDPQVPLVRYGLDSLGAVQLTMMIAARLRRDVPEDLLIIHPDIESLESFVRGGSLGRPRAVARSLGLGADLDQMLADSVLPRDICPDSSLCETDSVDSILLTGATGFLGAFLLRALLRETAADVYCLVRSADPKEATARVRGNLERYGIWEVGFEARVKTIRADFSKPRLGIDVGQLDFLVQQIDTIYHCGASVNWVVPYAGLRDVNVLGTLELLRFACQGRPKPFHFVSSISVCYSNDRVDDVTENDELIGNLGGIYLGYAQSKCVAESLVRRANERGLPATIHRPTLIAGDGSTGRSNPDDLLSKMIRGCIQMGSAPDLDWVLDCCPVDFTADAIVRIISTAAEFARSLSPGQSSSTTLA